MGHLIVVHFENSAVVVVSAVYSLHFINLRVAVPANAVTL